MSFVWREFLDVSRELVAATDHTAPPEARERSAISRAYYAAFRRALQVFSNLGEYTPRRDGNDHQALPMTIKSDGEGRRREVGTILYAMLNERRWADYELTRPRRAMSAAWALGRAERVLVLLDEIVREAEAP